MPEASDIVVLPHFSPEEVAALKEEHARQEELHRGFALLDNSSERVREAMQRMQALKANNETETDSYAECLYEVGRIDEAIDLVDDPVKKEAWSQRRDAILGSPCCDEPKQLIREYPSMKHGKMVQIFRCPVHKTESI